VSAGESIVFDRIADSYDETRGGMERGRVAAEALHRLLPAGPLLEVGVGTGLVAAALTERGPRPVGVDLSRPMLARAAGRVPGRVAVGDAQRLPVGTDSVAGAYLVHVLHLVGDPAGVLAEAARVVRPGGRVVTSAFPDDPLDDDLHEVFRAVREQLEAERRPDDVATVLGHARAAGLVEADRVELRRPGSTPREAAERLATRSLSWMWTVDDDAWSRHVPAALDRLRALPGQDRPRPGPGPTLLALAHA
jgi:ubiquinone/menaquinone biosynthesis C-methylase UbiE